MTNKNEYPKFQPKEVKDTFTLLETFPFTLYGGWGPNRRVPGLIKIYQNEDSGDLDYYLEGTYTIKDVDIPFYAVEVSVDQWGTFYTFHQAPILQFKNNTIIAQEWGTDSFMLSLSKAIAKVADLAEPDKEKYLSLWRKE